MELHPLCSSLDFPAGTAPTVNDHVSVFTDEWGSTLVFVATIGVEQARAHHSELEFEAFPVIGGLTDGLILDPPEAAFIAACWETTRLLRHAKDPSEVVDVYAGHNEPRVLISLRSVVAYDVCACCRVRIGRDRSGEWYHTDWSGRLYERGCHASSYRLKGNWDPNLKKSAMAHP